MINAYYNGNYSSIEDVRIPLTDRSIYFGDGIYEAAIGKRGKIHLLSDHLDRFYSNSQKMLLNDYLDREVLINLLNKMIAYTDYEYFFLYFQLTRKGGERAHSYDKASSNLLITVKEISKPSPRSDLKLITLPDIRHSLCGVKTLNLLPAVLASKNAELSGCDEAVLVRNDKVTECAHSNIHIIKDGVLITHPTDGNILPGITRKRLLYFANILGIKTEERPFDIYEMINSDEVLVTSSSKLSVKACKINGQKIISKPNGIGSTLCKCIFEDFENI